MCGVVGFLGGNFFDPQSQGKSLLTLMADAISSRGPDHAGYWTNSDCRIGLGHRRLSILDLSDTGTQPMTCFTGRYVISFNGEIYNHLDLRSALEEKLISSGVNFAWRGHSDTETLLAGFAVWGIKATIKRCVGMFAFAAWDKKDCTLTLGRDRMGEKPIYYGWQGLGKNKCFIFGSELKALKLHPCFAEEINRDALRLYTRFNYIPAPYSIYSGIYKLQPGSLLKVSLHHPEPQIDIYWSLSNAAVSGNSSLLIGEPPEIIISQLENLLKSVVHQQMLSDVPLGAFLSGGIDSSTIVALMQSQSSSPIKTFSIGFEEEGYNEANHAKNISNYLGTDHTELYLTPQLGLDAVQKLPYLYCEPFADSSQIPTFLVSQLARKQVTVSLSGDGGDELFGGYNRYLLANNLWKKISYFPYPIRLYFAWCIRSFPPSFWNKALAPLQAIMSRSSRQLNIGDKLHKGADVLTKSKRNNFYLGLITNWEPDELVIGGQEPFSSITGEPLLLKGLDEVQRMMVMDSISYLPDDILVKLDRATMGASLEGRVPFLDHHVVEFAWRIPQNMKLRNGISKWILRQVLYKYVPQKIVDKPKSGFGVPIDQWLRGPLFEWAENLLDERRLRVEGFFNSELIRKKWTEHLAGKRNWQNQLWCILMFQAWLELKDG